VPLDAPLGDNDIVIRTEHGETTVPFRVTLEAPQISDFNPKSGKEGQSIYITGENFFEPLEVLFFDSIPGNILFHSPDSLVVEVPENVERGRITVVANGGESLTKENFFTVTDVSSAILPAGPTDSYLQLSGTDPGSIWVGGTESYQSGTENFGITSDLNNASIRMDLSSNGRDHTHLIIIVKEVEGSFNDFQITVPVDWDGWQEIDIPLNRFKDLNGSPPDPTKINLVKLHLYNELGSNQLLEVNVDNLKFIQVN